MRLKHEDDCKQVISPYRVVDFQRKLRDVTGTVRRIEYDPNR
jgi:ribosomal protein L2